MGRIADIPFIGFGLRPEWNPTHPLRASDVVVDVVTSCQFEQLPYFKNVASKLQDIFVQELSVAHIWGFQEKLNQVTPGPGYVLDPLMRQLMTGNVQLAAGQTIPNISASTPVTTPQHPLHSQTSNSTQSASTPHQDPNVSRSQASTALPCNTAPPLCPYLPEPSTPHGNPGVSRSQTSTVSPCHTALPSRPYPPTQSTHRQNPNVSHSQTSSVTTSYSTTITPLSSCSSNIDSVPCTTCYSD